MLETIIDGAKRKAVVAAARTATEEAAARCRGVVLRALAQDDDKLPQSNPIGVARTEHKDAADAAQHRVDFSMERHKHGAGGYLDVAPSQTTALDVQCSQFSSETSQLRVGLQLIEALGGGRCTGETSIVTR